MKVFKKEETEKTPYVYINPTAGVINFYGRSVPENAPEFYNDVAEKILLYSSKPQKRTYVNIFLEYINSSTSKCLMLILKKLDELHDTKDSEVSVNWFYYEDDEDMLLAGEDLASLLSYKFNFNDLSILSPDKDLNPSK